MQTIQLISLRHSAFYTPYLITFAGGFLKQQGLEAVYRCVSSVDELESALIKGDAHVAQSAVGVSMRQFAANTDSGRNNLQENEIIHFAQINQRDGFFIATSAQYHSAMQSFDWHVLEGQRIIVDHLFQPIATLKYVLHHQGVDLNQVEFIDAGNAQQSQQAFLAGEADFIHLQGPYPQQLVTQGKAKIVASVGAALGEMAYSSLCAHKNWLDSAMAALFIKAYKAALRYVQHASAEQLAEQISEQFDDIQHETLVSTIEAYQALGSWSTQACISEQAYQCANRIFLFSGDITSFVDYKDIVSNELCS
ncbi:ABC transporter substrate-binding protein [Beggiatoa alba]|nr:ABC transporter substrate-binding protein [Beggiatoa alba]